MAEAISGATCFPFKWFYRPEAVPVVQVVDSLEELSFEQLPGVLAEIDPRHWGAVRQVLIEAKLKAEAMLRSEEIIKQPQLSAYYQGWVNYADYLLANLEGLRAGETGSADRERADLR